MFGHADQPGTVIAEFIHSACGKPGPCAHCIMNFSSSTKASETQAKRHRLLSVALLAGLFIAGAGIWLFSMLGREVLAGITPGVDELRTAVHAAASPGLTRVMIAASRYGGPTWLISTGLVLAVAFRVRGWHRGAVLVVITLAGAGILDTVLKMSFSRVRPAAFFGYPLPTSASFPSGHALYATSVFGGAAVLLSSRVRTPVLRIVIWCLAVFLIGLIGLSRVYLGVHYPSDVLAGYSAGAFWVASVALADHLMARRRRSRAG
jgi:undecaprenyl-diphosphatase